METHPKVKGSVEQGEVRPDKFESRAKRRFLSMQELVRSKNSALMFKSVLSIVINGFRTRHQRRYATLQIAASRVFRSRDLITVAVNSS
ncbi:MAG: hypothetical protein DMG57_42870 [Acidobacteria bacterium]|nr:MAG: hypothetical protein DMG57_42870 [Acidobacteriota bacterium]